MLKKNIVSRTEMDNVDKGYLKLVLNHRNYKNPYKWQIAHYKSHNIDSPFTNTHGQARGIG